MLVARRHPCHEVQSAYCAVSIAFRLSSIGLSCLSGVGVGGVAEGGLVGQSLLTSHLLSQKLDLSVMRSHVHNGWLMFIV